MHTQTQSLSPAYTYANPTLVLVYIVFLIYINDKDTNISNSRGIKLTPFADNTSILITGEDIEDLTLNLATLNKGTILWFDNNRLIINNNKSMTLGFHHKLNKHIVLPDVILTDKLLMYPKQNFWESG
jgi:hypothetical protein